MSRIKIYYHQFIGAGDALEVGSPLHIDGVGLEPTSYYEEFGKNEPYTECPVWNHKVKKIYTLRSPIDLEIKFLKDGRISVENLGKTSDAIHDVCNVKVESSNTLQLEIPRFVFWTETKNVWIETMPHPLTSVKGNYFGMSGWWNLSRWLRPVSFGLHIVDNTQPVIIRRGDPVFQVTFHTKNHSDSFELIKKVPSEELNRRMATNLHIKRILKKFNVGLFEDEPSKCPFAFMFNKKSGS